MPSPVEAPDCVRCWRCRHKIAVSWGSGTKLECRHCGAVND